MLSGGPRLAWERPQVWNIRTKARRRYSVAKALRNNPGLIDSEAELKAHRGRSANHRLARSIASDADPVQGLVRQESRLVGTIGKEREARGYAARRLLRNGVDLNRE
jgi:hypothetical protein